MADDLSVRYQDLPTGSYDCVDRIVLNAFFPSGCSPGGFRTWWRALHGGSDDHLDDTRLMRMAARFSRRLRAWATSAGVPVIYCKPGERKHLIAGEYLADHQPGPGVFLVLVARAMALVWKVKRSAAGVLVSLERKTELIDHYSFHIMDPEWGHVTIKMSEHPPFGAQVTLNGHAPRPKATPSCCTGSTYRATSSGFSGPVSGAAEVIEGIEQHGWRLANMAYEEAQSQTARGCCCSCVHDRLCAEPPYQDRCLPGRRLRGRSP